MNRRGFLKAAVAAVAAVAAPAVVRADSLMRIVPRDVEVLVPVAQDIVIDQLRDVGLVNIRELARQQLAEWFVRRIDEADYTHVIASSDGVVVAERLPGLPPVVPYSPVLVDVRGKPIRSEEYA